MHLALKSDLEVAHQRMSGEPNKFTSAATNYFADTNLLWQMPNLVWPSVILQVFDSMYPRPTTPAPLISGPARNSVEFGLEVAQNYRLRDFLHRGYT